MPNPTDPRAVADDPSSIVQQMPEGGDDALKPCPFCGEAAKNFSQSQFWLRCSNPECGAEMVIRRDKDEAYSAWNRRATEADLRAEVIARRAAVAEAYQRGRESGMREAQGIARRVALERRSLHVGQAIAAEILYALSPETDGGQDG